MHILDEAFLKKSESSLPFVQSQSLNEWVVGTIRQCQVMTTPNILTFIGFNTKLNVCERGDACWYEYKPSFVACLCSYRLIAQFR